MAEPVHGGVLAARALKEAGVDTIFALSGGHILPLFDGARVEGIRIIDTRHEENAVMMAEGWALATGRVGVEMARGMSRGGADPRLRGRSDPSGGQRIAGRRVSRDPAGHVQRAGH